MQQIDVECAAAYELEHRAEARLLEEVVVIPEEHKDHRQQEEHRQGVGQ